MSTMKFSIEGPETGDDIAAGSAIVQKARGLVIRDLESHETAVEFLRQCRAALKRVEDKFGPACDAAFKAHRELTGLRGEIAKPFKTAADLAQNAIVTYERIERERAAEAARKAEAEAAAARAKAEAEARAEAARIEAEAREKAEAERAAAAAAAKAEGDESLAAAIESAPIEVEPVEIMAAPVPVAPVYVAPEISKSAGTHGRQTWTYQIENPAAIPREFLKPDEAKLAGYARSMKDAARVPGVRFFPKTTVVTKGL